MIPMRFIPYIVAGAACLGLAGMGWLYVRERESRARAEGAAQVKVQWDSAIVKASKTAFDSVFAAADKIARRVDTVRLQVINRTIPANSATLDSIKVALSSGSPIDSAMRALLLRGVARSDSLGKACAELANDCGRLRDTLAVLRPRYDAVLSSYDSLLKHSAGVQQKKLPWLVLGLGGTVGPCYTKGGFQPICASTGLTATIPLRRK